MAKYRGVKGSVSVGGNTMGEVTGWDFTPSRPYIEATSLGDAGKKGDLDYPGGTGRITARLDYDDTAQAAIIDMLVSNDDPTPIAFLGVVSGTGPKQISCNILPTSAPISAKVGGHIEVTFDFESDGAITIDWS